MNKNKILQSIKVIVLGLVVGFGINFAFAQIAPTWTPPTGTPSVSNNVWSPVNVGPSDQVKNGGLSVGSFLANLNSLFYGDVTIDSLKDPLATADRQVCVDSTGKIKVCDTTPPVVTPSCGTASGGLFTTVPTTNLCGTGSTLNGSVSSASLSTPTWTWNCKVGTTYSPTCSANTKIVLPSPLPMMYKLANANDYYCEITTSSSFTQMGPTLIQGGVGGFTYKWYKNGVLDPYYYDNYYNIDVAGTYSLRLDVKDLGGHTATTTETITLGGGTCCIGSVCGGHSGDTGLSGN
jgi:hypothetical protein